MKAPFSAVRLALLFSVSLLAFAAVGFAAGIAAASATATFNFLTR